MRANNRWILLGWLLAAVLQAKAADLPPEANGRVVIDYWEKWTGDEQRAMQLIVDDFNSSVGREKKIWVNYLTVMNVDQKTLIAAAGGVPPSVAGLWDPQVVQFATLKALEPLDDLAKEAGIIGEDYKRVYWESCHYQGHLWALPTVPTAVALYYNKDQMAAAGLDPEKPPATLAELDAYAAKMDVKDKSGRITQAGYFPMYPGWWIDAMPIWFGGSMIDSKTGKPTFTDPAVLRSWEWIGGYTDKLGASAARDFRSTLGNFGSPQEPFMVGQISMVIQGPWMSKFIEEGRPKMMRPGKAGDAHVGDDGLIDKEFFSSLPAAERRKIARWGVAPFPSAVKGQSLVSECPIDVLVIPRGAPHKAEAFEFMKFVNRQDVMEKLCTLQCRNSPLTNVSAEFLDKHPNPYIQVFEDLAKSPNAHGYPRSPIYQAAQVEFETIANKCGFGVGDPEALARECQDRLLVKFQVYEKRGATRPGE